MDDTELERTPNPFSAFANSRDHSRRQFASTAKFLLIALTLFCIVTATQVYLQRSRLSGILDGFSSRSTPEKLERLQELQASGVDGIPGIVAAVADTKSEVSEMSVKILSDLNREWLTLPSDQLAERRFVFADQLAVVSKTITDHRDPRWLRVQELARLAARDLIDSGCAENDTTYQRLMHVIATDVSTSPATSDVATANDGPLPIDLVDNAGASWTDWPPTSTTPTLYRRTVASFDSIDESAVVLLQPAGEDHSGGANARLLKPRFRPAATLADQSRERLTVDADLTSYWITQLRSASPFVRKGAVTELGKRGDQQSIAALQTHFEIEPDQTIRQQIYKHLER